MIINKICLWFLLLYYHVNVQNTKDESSLPDTKLLSLIHLTRLTEDECPSPFPRYALVFAS